MPISIGAVISKKIDKKSQEKTNTEAHVDFCNICYTTRGLFVNCLNSRCKLRAHMRCLSKYFLQPGEYVPVEGECPQCHDHFLWGDLIRKFKGCCDQDLQIDAEATNNLYLSDDE